MGYTLNMYDQCFANKIIEGKQCTVGYVDNLTAKHVSKKVLEDLKAELEN